MSSVTTKNESKTNVDLRKKNVIIYIYHKHDKEKTRIPILKDNDLVKIIIGIGQKSNKHMRNISIRRKIIFFCVGYQIIFIHLLCSKIILFKEFIDH